MCRFFIYKGDLIYLGDILTRPEHSLLTQARRRETYTPGVEASSNYCPAKQIKRDHAVNADGFGVGFFNTSIRPEGTLFKSILPAWSNNNLTELSEVTQCDVAFAHIRAASLGMPISEFNCHPFRIGKFMWMHNGGISGYDRVKRSLLSALPSTIYNTIRGTTDSETAFGIFMSQFPDQGLHGPGNQYTKDPKKFYTAKQIQTAMRNTIVVIMEAQKRVGMKMSDASSSLNFAVTDGQTVVAVRCRTHASQDPPSLYYGYGHEEFTLQGKKTPKKQNLSKRQTIRTSGSRTIALSEGGKAFIIASEPLDYVDAKWKLVPKDTMVVITNGDVITLVPLTLPHYKDIGEISLTPALTAADFEQTCKNPIPYFDLGDSPSASLDNSIDEDDNITAGNGKVDKRFCAPAVFRTLALSPTNSPCRRSTTNTNKETSPVQFSCNSRETKRPSANSEKGRKPKRKNVTFADETETKPTATFLIPFLICTFVLGIVAGRASRN